MPQLTIEKSDNQVAGADLGIAEHECPINPGTLDNGWDVRCEVRDGSGTPGQLVKSGNEICGQAGRIDLKMFQDTVDVRVLRLEQLVKPVHSFHVRVTAHLAENRGAFDCLVADAVELAEK